MSEENKKDVNVTKDNQVVIAAPDSKIWWKSKTIVFNVLAIIVMVAGSLGYTGQMDDPAMQKKLETIIPLVVAIVNMILRSLSKGEKVRAM